MLLLGTRLGTATQHGRVAIQHAVAEHSTWYSTVAIQHDIVGIQHAVHAVATGALEHAGVGASPEP